MRVVEIASVHTFFEQVIPLALWPQGDDMVFRGQQSAEWRIQSTFSRFSTVRIADHHALAVDQLTERFIHGMAQVGQLDERMNTRRAKLELARHHGVPSPLIDVSRFPLIALWFAFNGVRGSESSGSSALYAINYNTVSTIYHRIMRVLGREAGLVAKYGRPVIDSFRWDNATFFDKGYPLQEVKFIPLAASWNIRMQRQQGAFFYDLLNFAGGRYESLEEMINDNDPRAGQEGAALTKFVIPHAEARYFFDFMDVSGVNGSMIYNDHTGVVSDLLNSFNYNTRAGNWDLRKDRD